MFNVLIDDRKKNLSDANRVSFLYKIKFILYTLLTMLAVVFLVFNFFGSLQIMKKIRLFQWNKQMKFIYSYFWYNLIFNRINILCNY